MNGKVLWYSLSIGYNGKWIIIRNAFADSMLAVIGIGPGECRCVERV